MDSSCAPGTTCRKSRTAFARAASRGAHDRLEGEVLEFHERVLKGYDALVAEEPSRWLRLDGQGSPDAVFQALWRVQAVDPGFRPEGVLTLRTSLTPQKYGSTDRRLAFYRQVIDEVRALPGVTGAAIGLLYLENRHDVLGDGQAAEDRRFLREIADSEDRPAVHREIGDVL